MLPPQRRARFPSIKDRALERLFRYRDSEVLQRSHLGQEIEEAGVNSLLAVGVVDDMYRELCDAVEP